MIMLNNKVRPVGTMDISSYQEVLKKRFELEQVTIALGKSPNIPCDNDPSIKLGNVIMAAGEQELSRF